MESFLQRNGKRKPISPEILDDLYTQISETDIEIFKLNLERDRKAIESEKEIEKTPPAKEWKEVSKGRKIKKVQIKAEVHKEPDNVRNTENNNLFKTKDYQLVLSATGIKLSKNTDQDSENQYFGAYNSLEEDY